MSKYTTEVRYICEQKSGLEESVGFASVDNVLNNAWDKIFTTRCTFFDESYRPILCKKILKHYYMREIGAETVGLWLLWLNTKLEEIMPYYNQLYRSELLQFDPFNNVDLTRTKEKTGEERGSRERDISGTTSNTEGGTTRKQGSISDDKSGSSSISGQESGTYSENSNGSSEKNNRNAYSDTPQSNVIPWNLQDHSTEYYTSNYLTDYREIRDTDTNTAQKSGTTGGTNSGTSSYSDERDETHNDTITHGKTLNGTNSQDFEETTSLNSTEEYLERLVGKNGTYNQNKMLQDYRDTFLNIDMLVIGEFKSLFMGLW